MTVRDFYTLFKIHLKVSTQNDLIKWSRESGKSDDIFMIFDPSINYYIKKKVFKIFDSSDSSSEVV